MKKTWQEFKDFAVKGNAIDLAVGVVIGAAFGKIVSSIVDDLIMPLVGSVTGDIDFSDKVVNLPWAPKVEMHYGAFLNVLINFAIVAASIFVVVKAINKLKKPEAVPAAAPAATPEDIQLLREIRDSLKSR